MTIQLHHGDCLDVLRGLADASVDAVICDPPYGQTACTFDTVIPVAPLWEQLRRVAKPSAAICLFASQPFTSVLVMSNPREYRHEWIWRKNMGSNFLNTVREPMKEHESVLVFSRGGWTYNPQLEPRSEKARERNRHPNISTTPLVSQNYRRMTDRRAGRPELRGPSSVQQFACERGLHPQQKPVDLCTYLVRTYTNPGDTVLDFAMGSGTTGAAALQEGRGFIGMEKDAEHYATAARRIAAAQQTPSLFAMAGDD